MNRVKLAKRLMAVIALTTTYHAFSQAAEVQACEQCVAGNFGDPTQNVYGCLTNSTFGVSVCYPGDSGNDCATSGDSCVD